MVEDGFSRGRAIRKSKPGGVCKMDDRGRPQISSIKKCTHHWIIDNHNSGMCQKCGEQRQFGYSDFVGFNYGGSMGVPRRAKSKKGGQESELA